MEISFTGSLVYLVAMTLLVRRHTDHTPDWISIDNHKDFMNSPQYKPFMEILGSITAGPIDVRHVKFDSYSTKPMAAPVTEMYDMYLPASASDEKKQELAYAWSNLRKAVLNDEGSEGAMDGPVAETVSHKSLGDEEGYALMAIVGWKSLEKHTEFRNSEPFKASIGAVRAAVHGSGMGHAILRKS